MLDIRSGTTGSPSVLSLEPPAVHATRESNDEGVANPPGSDCDLVVGKLGEEIRTEICPDNAEAPFHDSKEPQPRRLTRCPKPTEYGYGYQQQEIELQSDRDHG
jgi:hypothetical protein